MEAGAKLQSHRDHPASIIGEIHSSGVKTWITYTRPPATAQEAAEVAAAVVDSFDMTRIPAAEFQQAFMAKMMQMEPDGNAS